MKIYIDRLSNAEFTEEVIMHIRPRKLKLKVGDRFHFRSPLLRVTEVNPYNKYAYMAVAVPVKEKRNRLTRKRGKR